MSERRTCSAYSPRMVQRPAHSRQKRSVSASAASGSAARGASGGLELGFEDQGVGAVLPAQLAFSRRGNLPAAMLRRAEKRGEAGARVEARPAQPVDRAVAPDQRGGLAVADQRVIFNSQRP